MIDHDIHVVLGLASCWGTLIEVSSCPVLYTPFAWTKMELEPLTSFKPMAAG